MKRILSLILLSLACTWMSAQTIWRSPLYEDGIYVQGRGWNDEQNFRRLPERMHGSVPERVWYLSGNGAGLHVDFFTDAKEITVKYTVSDEKALNNVVMIATSGIDLYSIGSDGKWLWCSCFGNFDFGKEVADTVVYRYTDLLPCEKTAGREYRLFLPLYNSVTSMTVGVPAGSAFSWKPVSTERPIVVYGTSIAQGASASRPAMAWTNILHRELDIPVINLGFSGSGKLEPEMFDALAEIDARMYIIDCMPNMTGLVSEIVPRLTAGVRKLREHSSAPILLVDHDGYNNAAAQPVNGTYASSVNGEQAKAFRLLQDEGVKDIQLMTMDEIGLSGDMDSQIDGVHPNDIGMRLYANAYMKYITRMLDL